MFILEDPKLASSSLETEDDDDDEEHEIDPEEQLENIRKKLKTDHKKLPKVSKSYNLGDERMEERKKKLYVFYVINKYNFLVNLILIG